MKERLIHNLGLKILSIFLAFLIWLGVINVSNPEVNRSKEVTLEIENEQVLLDARRAYEVNGKKTVTVTYDVRTRDEYKVRPSDFRAYIDLAELYDVTGSVPVKVEILNNNDIIANVEAKPGVARVLTEELQTKRFKLKEVLTGEAEEGYALNGITLAPEFVSVEGPISQVGLISHVGVEIPLEGLSSDNQGVVEPVFYDANGNVLKVGSRVSVNTSEIRYQLLISKVKSLPLDFEVAGVVAPGYQYTGVECSRKSVSVVGLKSSLASLNTITIPASELNVEGASQDKVVTVDLNQYLPEGVSIVETEDTTVEIHLKIERLVTRQVTLSESDIAVKGMAEALHYRLVPSRIDVTIRGLSEDLDSLDAKDLKASLNLDELAEGTHVGALEFEESDVFSVVGHSEFEIQVTRKLGFIGEPSGDEADENGETFSSSEGESGDSQKEAKQESIAAGD